MRLVNRHFEALGLNARLIFGHGMMTRFELFGDPNPLANAANANANAANANVANANAGHVANGNANNPFARQAANVNAGHGANVNANNPFADNLGPVKVEAPEPQADNAPYYGPPVRRPRNVHLNPFALDSTSSDDDIVIDEPVPAKKKILPKNRKRTRQGNVTSDSKKVKVEFEEVNFGSKIIGLINDLQKKDKKNKKKNARESFEVLDLNKPKSSGKRRRDDDDDDDMSGTGLGFGGPKRARFMRGVY